MKQMIIDTLPYIVALFTGILGKVAIDRTTRRKKEIDLYEQMEKAIQDAQNDISDLRTQQTKQFEAMTQLLLEKQSLEMKVKFLQDENTRLKAVIKRLQSKLNNYINDHK